MIEVINNLPERYGLVSITWLRTMSLWSVCVYVTEPRPGMSDATGLGSGKTLEEAAQRACDHAEYRFKHSMATPAEAHAALRSEVKGISLEDLGL